MRALLQAIRRRWRRWFHRRDQAEAPDAHQDQVGPGPVLNAERIPEPEEEGETPFGPNQTYEQQLRDAAAAIYAPRHRDGNRVRIQPLHPGEDFETDAETWERHGGGFVATRTRTLVQTCTNQIVPLDQVRCFCSRCHGFDIREYRCAACGQAFCRLHIRLLELPGSSRLYCEAHLPAAIDHWNVWADLDPSTSLAAWLAILVRYPKISIPDAGTPASP